MNDQERSDALARAFTVLGLLRDGGVWQVAELAGRLGSSTRTVRRDIRRLRDLGSTIIGVPGRGGGYRLIHGPDLADGRAWGAADSAIEREFRFCALRDEPLPCTGTAIVQVSADLALRYAWPETRVEPLATNVCRIRFTGWSWGAVAAYFTLFDAPFDIEGPHQLRAAARELADRVSRAAGGSAP